MALKKAVFSRLVELSLPGDALEITRLELPEVALGGATVRERYDVGAHFADLWRACLACPVEDIAEHVEADETPEDVWSRLNLVTGLYYTYCTQDFITGKAALPKGELVPPGVADLTRERSSFKVEGFVHDLRRWSEAMYVQHLAFYVVMALMNTIDAAPRALFVWGRTREPGEASAHRLAFGTAALLRYAPHETLRLLAGELVRSQLEVLHEFYKARRAVYDSDLATGPFSAIRLDQLQGLAARDRALLKRYGEARAAAAFEQQIALLLQSIGFFVVRTRPGERTVDLVCISGDPTERITVIVDAKSTSRPYSLPTKDERALREYIEEVRRTLTTLGPLRYVLVVGPSPSKTLAGKLQRLEQDSGVPLRFVTASALAKLRDQLPGQIPMRALTESVLGGDHVLSDDFAKGAVDRYQTEQQAHSDFVRQLLALGSPDLAAELDAP